jgi:hypothetical protein
MADDLIPFKEPGDRITGRTTAAVIGKRCLKISGDRTSGPGLSATSEGSLYRVAHADAAGRIVGVAAWSAASGKDVTIVRGSKTIVPIRAEANIAAFEEVQVGTAGQVIPLAAGVAIGYAMSAALANTDAEISLY